MTPVQWAKPCEKPEWLGDATRKRGPKAKGLRYEREVARALPQALHGKWFVYARRDNRVRWCQPDFLWLWGSMVLVIECKLTWVPEAVEKLREVYIPVVKGVVPYQVMGAVICRNLAPGVNQYPIVDTPQAALAATMGRPMCVPVIHWLGGTSPLVAQGDRRPLAGLAPQLKMESFA